MSFIRLDTLIGIVVLLVLWKCTTEDIPCVDKITIDTIYVKVKPGDTFPNVEPPNFPGNKE